MDLRILERLVPGFHWLGENKAQLPCPLPGHPDGDPELSIIARQVDGQCLCACFGDLGHTAGQLLAAFEDLERHQSQDSPADERKRHSETFSSNGSSSNGTGSHSNGTKPHSDPRTWKILVYRMSKNILEHDGGKSPEILASVSPDILLDGVLKDLHRGLAAGTLNPLPELNEVELEEEIQFAARAAIKDFIAQYGPKPSTPPKDEPPEEKISALHLNQLYDMIDQWDRQPWVWSGILPHSSLSLIVGKSETGKSTLVYSLIYAIVTGTPFFGRDCEQGRVIYLAGDPMSEIVAGKTFRNLGLSDGVVVVPDALVMNPTGMEQLRALVTTLKPALVVGDTLAATVKINPDNYSDSYLAQMPLVRMARELKPNFLMCHHSQKSAIDSYNVIDAALGSVGIAAVASSRMVTRKYRRKGRGYHTFEMSNLRIGQPLQGEYIIHKTDNGLVELAGLWKTENTALDKEQIVAALQRRGVPLAKRTLWQETRPKPKWDPFNEALDELLAERKIRISEGKRGAIMFELVNE
jgi:hypothetical protein